MTHNHHVNPTGRTVTGLAQVARPARAQPAGYVERWADKGGGWFLGNFGGGSSRSGGHIEHARHPRARAAALRRLASSSATVRAVASCRPVHRQQVSFRTGSVVAAWVSWCRATVYGSEGQGFRSMGYGFGESDDAASACDRGVGTGHEQRGQATEPGQRYEGGVYRGWRTGRVNGWSSRLQ
jgi:hypothetical protein